MAEPIKKAKRPEVEETGPDAPVITDAMLDAKHLRVLVKELRPLMTLGEWLVCCAALDAYAENEGGRNPIAADIADRLASDWLLKVTEVQGRTPSMLARGGEK